MKHCFAKAPQYEASPFHSDMKHFAYAPYDVRKWKMRVYPFAIQRYPHYIMTCNPVLYGWIFLCPAFTHRIASIYSNIIAPTENKQRTVKSPFPGVFCIDPLKILCLVRSLVLSKRLFRNHITINFSAGIGKIRINPACKIKKRKLYYRKIAQARSIEHEKIILSRLNGNYAFSIFYCTH